MIKKITCLSFFLWRQCKIINGLFDTYRWALQHSRTLCLTFDFLNSFLTPIARAITPKESVARVVCSITYDYYYSEYYILLKSISHEKKNCWVLSHIQSVVERWCTAGFMATAVADHTYWIFSNYRQRKKLSTVGPHIKRPGPTRFMVATANDHKHCVHSKSSPTKKIVQCRHEKNCRLLDHI